MEVPRPFYAQLVEWRARSIGDPVERLRFLRRSMPPPRWRLWLPLRLAAALVLCASAVAVTLGSVFVPSRTSLRIRPAPGPEQNVPHVWMVERRGHLELYSNGLQIDSRYAVRNEPRAFRVFLNRPGQPPLSESRTEPAGIVFHTTESLLAPFEANYNRTLQRLGQELLIHIQRNKSYHFLVDRFGRVFRIVEESDSAHHAGRSVWADRDWKYVNLNHSFIGVSFETQTESGQRGPTITSAQIHSGRILTELLRNKYKIAGINCVTHAQVSVNAAQMLVGYHTDWGSNFPFAQMGLPDNYVEPLPGIYAFGFGYDPGYVKVTGPPLWQGLLFAEERLRGDALSTGLTVEAYRYSLRRSYRQMIAASKETAAHKEKD